MMLDQRSQLLLAVAAFRRHAIRVFDAVKECETRDEAIELYTELYDFSREALSILDTAAARVLELTDYDQRFEPVPLSGSGVLKIGGGRERTRYYGERLVGRYAKEITPKLKETYNVQFIIDDGGENITDRLEKMVLFVADVMSKATGATAPSFDNWRSGVAKEFGIKLNDYADKSETPLTVRIEGRDRTA